MTRIIAAVAAALLAMVAGPATARDGAVAGEAAGLSPNRFVWSDQPTISPVTLVISIPDQRAYVYRGDRLIGASSVSTGRNGKPTPTGIFTVLQKAERHRSSLYNAASMPYMQRLTWDGVAIHAGPNPGFPASHGCIRVPTAFAQRLFAITSLGTVVWVVDEPGGDLHPAAG